MFFYNFVSKAEYSIICSRFAEGTFFDRLHDIGSKMHFKNDVLSEFRKVRSSERIDLICSLLDACLPFELRFLGTCLEFLGKRDFNELREDERLANNVNHLSQFRSLTDENTRRKLVLYVSLLKSSNSDCANYFSDILAGINMDEVGLVHGTVNNESSLEAMNKLMDELLLLYTIALNHPAFTIHQKTKFAGILGKLQEEDRKLCAAWRSGKDSNVKFSSFCQRCRFPEGVGDSAEPGCSLKMNDDVLMDMPLTGSSRSQMKSLSAPLVCHVTGSPTYSAMEAPSPTLSQVSTVSLSGPPPQAQCQVIVSSVCGHTTMTPPVQVQSKTSLEMMSTLSPMGDRPPSQTSNVMPQAPPHMPPSGTVPSSTSPCLLMNPSMIVPVGVPQGPVSSSSHCIIPSTGDLNMSKHPMLPSMLNMSPDSLMHMPFPGPTWGVMVSMPAMGNPTPSPSPNSGPVDNANVAMPPGAPREGGPPPSVPEAVTPLSLSRQSSPSSSRAPTPPRKTHYSKGHPPYHHNPHHGPPPLHQQHQQPPQPLSAAPPHSAVPSSPVTPTQPLPRDPSAPGVVPPPATGAPQPTLPGPGPSPGPGPGPGPVPANPANPAPPSSALPMHPPPPPPPQRAPNCTDNWDVPHMTVDSYKEEAPKYLANFQDFSPEELRHMGDEELKERGMPPEALVQLRSCVNKQNAANGLNCANREVHDTRGAWRLQGIDAPPMPPPLPPQLLPMQPCYATQTCYMIPCTAAGKAYRKCDAAGCRQLTQQMRSVRLEDDRRPCSNGSSASDSSCGSHSPPDTPVLIVNPAVPPHQHWDRGHHRKDSCGGGGGGGNVETWPNTPAPEERLHEDGRPERVEPERNDRTEWAERGDDRIRNFQPPAGQRSTLNRPRGLSKVTPPGIQTISRGRGHHGLDKSRREAGPLNGEMTPPGPFSITTPLTVGNNVPYTTPVSTFLTHSAYPTIPTYHTFRHGAYMPHNQPAYPYHHNGELWNHQFPQSTPHPSHSHNYIRHMVAFSPAVPPPKLSCYNCGAQGHVGVDCKESTFEEIAQQGQYHLDYKPLKEPGDCPSEK